MYSIRDSTDLAEDINPKPEKYFGNHPPSQGLEYTATIVAKASFSISVEKNLSVR
jgi:hypothetical protein